MFSAGDGWLKGGLLGFATALWLFAYGVYVPASRLSGLWALGYVLRALFSLFYFSICIDIDLDFHFWSCYRASPLSMGWAGLG